MDLFRRPSTELYDAVFSRLVYAPESAMSNSSADDELETDDDDEENMVALRRGAIEAARYAQEGGE